MNRGQRIKAAFSFQKTDHLVDIFGYCTKGVPGLEIIGLGAQGRVIKEKFIYLSRSQEIGLPLRRYVLCLEENPLLKEASADELRWLELPMLILFWSLGKQLFFSKLEDCLACGLVTPGGRILSRVPNISNWPEDWQLADETFKLIAKFPPKKEHPRFFWFSLEAIFEGFEGLKIEDISSRQIESARANSR